MCFPLKVCGDKTGILCMWLPGRIKDVGFIVVGHRGTDEENEGVDGKENLAEHGDSFACR